MANFLTSPGVSLNEIDNTFISPIPVKVGAAIIGPTVKGPVEIPIVVTSYSDYKNRFGGSFVSGSDTYSYLTSIAAYNYFNNGGNSLLVARIVTGSYTPATSTTIPNYIDATSSSFALETISEGVIMNNSGTLNADGSLVSGSLDNVRWEITNSNTGSGTFNVIIRQGNDRTNKKVVLESFTNVNLDPNSPRFISSVIGDQIISYNSTENQIDIVSGSFSNNSRYVRVKNVTPTPNYLDNSGVAVSAYTASIPQNGSGSFSGATGDVKGGANFYENINNTDTQGLTSGNYTNMVNLFSNKDDYSFNTLLTPGLLNSAATHTGVISSIITNTQLRGDNIYVVDMVGYDGTLAEVVTQAQTRDNSYAATYWPWLRIQDPETGKRVWVPASTMIGGVYAHTDKVAAPWFAPAGINRGGLGSVLRAKNKLSQLNRDELYANNINPIATFPRKGIVVFGQKTLQKDASALDRVNVRRLLIELKSFIGQTADTLVFEQNSITTRNKFLATVNPYLENIKQKQGLYAFKVIMDDSLNTPDVIDRNQLVGQIYIQPTRTAEFINLDFILQPTGAEFPA
jgi:phage tail sheath protein FI